VPRLSEQTRATRRHHILTSAWICFSRNGFQATSMDEVIAQTGMSSSAVYRYFRGKDELIDATAEAGLTRIRDIFAGALESRPIATPSDMLDILVSDLRAQTSTPEYDITRIAIQSWAEALRRPPLRQRTRQLYREAGAARRTGGPLAGGGATARGREPPSHGNRIVRHDARPADQSPSGRHDLPRGSQPRPHRPGPGNSVTQSNREFALSAHLT